MPIPGALLSFTDGLGLHGADASQIIIVAATNAAHRIDAALLRPGRLGRVIRIAPPDAEALDGILRLEEERARLVHLHDRLNPDDKRRIDASLAKDLDEALRDDGPEPCP